MNKAKLLSCVVLFFFTYPTCTVQAETDAEIEKELTAKEAAYKEYSVYLDELSKAFAEQMREEFDIYGGISGGVMHRKINRIKLKFNAPRRGTVDEARSIALHVTEKFVEHTNAFEKIQPFLENPPFTRMSLETSLRFFGTNGYYNDNTVYYFLSSPHDSTYSDKHCFYYSSKDPYTGDHPDILSESYEEAIARNAASPVANPAIHKETEQERVVDEFIFSFRDSIIRKHKLECWSIGAKTSEKVDQVGARFVARRRATQDVARTLILNIVNELMVASQKNEKIAPYLKEIPLSLDKLKIRVEFKKRNSGKYRDGTMESVSLEDGVLTYFREMPKEEREKLLYVPHVQKYASETYEEATQKQIIVEQTPKSWVDNLYLFFNDLFSEW